MKFVFQVVFRCGFAVSTVMLVIAVCQLPECPIFCFGDVVDSLVTQWEAPGGFGASSGLWLANFSSVL